MTDRETAFLQEICQHVHILIVNNESKDYFGHSNNIPQNIYVYYIAIRSDDLIIIFKLTPGDCIYHLHLQSLSAGIL